jgi:hypothetical protein
MNRALALGRDRAARERREAYLADQRRLAEARALTPRARAGDGPGERDPRFAELDKLLADEKRYSPQRAAAGGSDGESEGAE